MKLPRRKLLRLAAGAVALPALSRLARADAYPTRPVHIVVGFAAGSAFDILARASKEYRAKGRPGTIEEEAGHEC
jgi:tripartite-type tricarboxylate transporter receptor subunit TctC